MITNGMTSAAFTINQNAVMLATRNSCRYKPTPSEARTLGFVAGGLALGMGGLFVGMANKMMSFEKLKTVTIRNRSFKIPSLMGASIYSCAIPIFGLGLFFIKDSIFYKEKP